MSALHLVFPVPLNIANSRMHWRVKHREKTDFWALCDFRASVNAMPPPPRKPLTRALMRSVMYLHSPMDDDNAIARYKWILDWLKTRGYIVDDKRTCVTWIRLPDQVIDRRNPRIEITLEEPSNGRD